MKELFPKLLLLFTVSLLFSSCTTETETIIYESPNIEITSVVTNSLNSYTLYLDIREGEGQVLQKVEIVFKDITIEGEENINLEYAISDYESLPNRIEASNLKRNHDYEVTAYLYTNKYIYHSDLQILRSIKNTYQVRIWDDERFSYLDESISAYFNKEDEFVVNIDFENEYEPQSLEIKLNGTIPLEIDASYNDISQNDGIITLTKLVKIPMDAPIGEHHVHVYIDGFEFVSVNKLKLLEGQWKIFDSRFEDFVRGDFSWFKIDNRLFLVGGNYFMHTLTESPVWEFSIENKSWNRKENFPHMHNIDSIQSHGNIEGRVEILPHSIQYDNQGYILARYGNITELWKYQILEDNWEKVSIFPGTTFDHMTCFVINDKLYLGGGTKYDNNAVDERRRNKEFWCYSFNKKNWVRQNDIPVEILFWRLSTCTSNNNAYVFSTYNNFWEYNQSEDNWAPLGKFPGSDRYHTQMVSLEGDIYLIGGESTNQFGDIVYRQDCWRYSPLSHSWEMIALFSQPISDWGISFTYNNGIYTGLGYYKDRYDWIGEIYKLNME